MNIVVHIILAFLALVAATGITVAGVETWREERRRRRPLEIWQIRPKRGRDEGGDRAA